jgi:DNA-binding transcriptional LysR family regulator
MDINPVHVRTLQAIARSGSFSRAGETLHLSQPAISHHVRHLERTVGVPLLIRRGRRASPTEAGTVLLEQRDARSRCSTMRARRSSGSGAAWPAG